MEESKMRLEYGLSLKFKSKETEEAYFYKSYPEEKLKIILICGLAMLISFIELVTHFVIDPAFYEEQTLKDVVMVSNICYIVLSLSICIVCILKGNNHLYLKASKVVLYFCSISYYLVYFETLIGYQVRYTVKLRYFYFLLIYFNVTSSLLFKFNIAKTVVNLTTLVFINVRVQTSETEDVNISGGDDIFAILFLVTVFEFFAHHHERRNRELFCSKLLNEKKKHYYFDLLSNAKNGLAIFKNGNLEFANTEIENNKEYFPELFSSRIWSKQAVETIVSKYFEQESSPINYSTELTNITSERQILQTKLKFEHLGLFKSNGETKYFDIYVSEHQPEEDCVRLVEVMIVDLTVNMQAKEAQADMIFKNYIQSKVSHEFISTLIAIKTETEDLNTQPTAKKVSTKKILNLSDYLIFLVEELVMFVEDTSDSKIVSSNFDLVSILERNIKIATTINSTVGNGKQHKVDSIIALGDKVSALTTYKINLKMNEKMFSNFILNVLIFVFKIAEVDIKIQIICEKSQNKATKINFLLEFNSPIDVKLINNVAFGAYNYSELQGIDFSVAICNKISSILGLDFKVNKGESKTVVEFSCEATKILRSDFSEIQEESFSESSANQTQLFQKGYYYSDDSNIELKQAPSKNIDSKSEYSPEMATKRIKKARFSSIGQAVDNEHTFKPESPKLPCVSRAAEKRMNIVSFNGHTRNGLSVLAHPINRLDTGSSCEEDSFTTGARNIILVADDIVMMRKQLCSIIKKVACQTDYTVEEVEDGSELLLRIIYYNENPLEGKIVLVISDEFMGDLNGSEALRILNIMVSRGKVKEVPFVFNTAFLDEATLARIESTDPNMILTKPISKSQMVNVFDTMGMKR